MSAKKPLINVENYLTRELGVDTEALRRLYLDPAP
jgi:hypothetical protein